MNTSYTSYYAIENTQARLEKMVEALVFAFGGYSQVPLESIALALVGQINNQGLFSTKGMQYYNLEQAILFKERINDGIKYCAAVFDEESDFCNAEEIRKLFWKHYKMPISLAE
jgi:hypothetical protein